jgi:hypothetical protein
MEHLLEKFIAIESKTTWMRKPFIYDGKIAATNGHAIIIIDDNRLLQKYGRIPEMSNKIDFALKDCINEQHVLKVADFQKAYDLWLKFPVYKTISSPCDACNGTGLVEFVFDYDNVDYETTDTCPICDGNKTIEDISKEETGQYILSDQCSVKVLNGHFTGKFLESILFLTNELCVTEITSLFKSGYFGAHMFQITDKVQLIYMPCVNNTDIILHIQ